MKSGKIHELEETRGKCVQLKKCNTDIWIAKNQNQPFEFSNIKMKTTK